MKHLLVPVDFSNASNLVVERAGELAQELPARIVLLHVDEPKPVCVALGDAVSVTGVAWPLETPKRISARQARLSSLAGPLKVSGVEVESVALVGLVVDDILEQADKYRADYIIVGSQGHLAASHLFSRIVFNDILNRTACPMILFPLKPDA